MSYVVNTDINLDDLNSDTGTYTHTETGITITFNSYNDDRFQAAQSKIATREKLDSEAIKEQDLDPDSFLDDIDANKKTTGKILINAVGRYLIADWEVKDQNGDKLPITGKNFEMLIASLPVRKQPEFFQWCINRSIDVTLVSSQALEDTKKKLLKDTTGKKTTQK